MQAASVMYEAWFRIDIHALRGFSADGVDIDCSLRGPGDLFSSREGCEPPACFADGLVRVGYGRLEPAVVDGREPPAVADPAWQDRPAHLTETCDAGAPHLHPAHRHDAGQRP